MDVGTDPGVALASRGALRRLQWILLTHRHPDHAAGLPLLAHQLRFADRTEPVRLAGPPDAVEAAMKACDIFEVQPGHVVPAPLPDARVGTIQLNHPVPCLGYVVGPIAAFGDTGPVSLEPRTDVEVLVQEASHHDPARTHPHGHSTPEDAVAHARALGARHLLLQHVHPTGWTHPWEGGTDITVHRVRRGQVYQRRGPGRWELAGHTSA